MLTLKLQPTQKFLRYIDGYNTIGSLQEITSKGETEKSQITNNTEDTSVEKVQKE